MSNIINRRTEDTAIDVVNAIVGVCLVLAPWAFGFARDAGAAWNAWIVGAVVAIIAIGALVSFNQWEEWLNLVLGIWAIVAPWVMGFSAITAATYAHVIAGMIVAVLAAAELWLLNGRRPSPA